MKQFLMGVILFAVSCPLLAPGNPADQWVATDGAGRRLPTHADVGDVRPDKRVGVFYYLWVGNHTRKVHDITEIIKQPKGRREWGAKEAFHFWGEPEYGYYHASDPWVIRRDMQMLANAGVDFIYFDTTNAVLYPETVLAVCRVIARMRKEGIAAPSICYTTYWNSGKAMNGAYDHIYAENRFPEVWFRWEGKPLIFGKADDPELRPEVKEFFTIKECWVGGGEPQKNKWNWLSLYPQSYGYSESPDVPEQVPVAVAAHPENPQGKSFHNGEQPPVDENHLSEFTGQGLHVQEQWSRAHELDPRIVMVSQWNEWLAQRFFWNEERHKQRKGLYAGRPIEVGDSFFVDVYNREFNRDMAPMKGGYTDNYYYQLVSNIRKFKGMEKPAPRPEPVSIQIDGRFGDWDQVQTVHTDPLGDTLHRDFEGTDPETRYVNKTGRNDIVESRAVVEGSSICFQVSTREDLSPHTDPNWMLLFIDVDQDHATGWEGYDLVINRKPLSAAETSMEKWTSKGWESIGEIEMAYTENQLELRMPLAFDPSTRPDFGFDFKWADHPRNCKDITAFFLDGDAAPDRRFNYRF